ncbi:pseudouridylate synthase [Pontibacter vulgaris]|uniref:pseudouridylate synthase n=1 Tax=Pontibacter vulgaris TaxID=2905679 RepID=UPI001FA76196|nr:pseudouridylate synthase [Pontibacter vulgaris]
MLPTVLPKTNYFIPFNNSVKHYPIPEKFTYPFDYKPHPISLLASEELKGYLTNYQEWDHNFGLTHGKEGKVIGKMFGVLVVKTEEDEIGYLAAFSGKLAGGYHHPFFVPPVYDALTEGSFLNVGMQELTRINLKIKRLEESGKKENAAEIEDLQKLRKQNSIDLQGKLFDRFHFLNKSGREKSLRTIFQGNSNSNPPAGAGECAAPKLLQYAFQNQLKPIAMAEFWWGLSPKSDYWKHGHFYPACREKCEPILTYMLEGIELDEAAG